MPRPNMMALWLLCCASSLSACQTPQVQTQVVEIPPPAVPGALLAATLGPFKPAPGGTQKTAALVIEDFTEALAACNADKAAIAQILRLTAK